MNKNTNNSKTYEPKDEKVVLVRVSVDPDSVAAGQDLSSIQLLPLGDGCW